MTRTASCLGRFCRRQCGARSRTMMPLHERQWSAVMAVGGLLCLANLAGFGIDLAARTTLGG